MVGYLTGYLQDLLQTMKHVQDSTAEMVIKISRLNQVHMDIGVCQR